MSTPADEAAAGTTAGGTSPAEVVDGADAAAPRSQSAATSTSAAGAGTGTGPMSRLQVDPAFARRHLRWWRELLYVAVFYFVYSWIRNRFGSASVDTELAFEHARQVIDLEQMIGLYHEEAIQQAFLDNRFFIQVWNVFYGTFHFVVTAFAMVYLFVRHPERYALWRNTLAFTTALALVGFALYPLMPPRLLDECGQYGACQDYGFVDTLAEYGGLWSFDSGAIAQVSNQFAAMPSLHFGWSMWCFLALYSVLRNRPGKLLIAVYPWLTLFAIIVTGNHFWIDAVGGALILLVGYVLARPFTKAVQDHQRARERAQTTGPANPADRG